MYTPTYMYHVFLPIPLWMDTQVAPYVGYCKKCCNKHRAA